ncbi:MAG: alpha/beta hydrolase [Clostridia bacterium]|nr:alpha/beta hydrolase [Clostridia bacterium]
MVIFSVIVILILLFWFTFGYVCFSSANRRRKSRISERNDFCGGGDIPEASKRKLKECRNWIDESRYEPIYITSKDGKRLFSKLIAQDGEAKGTVIFVHGYHSSARRDLAIQAKSAYDGGYNILLICHRAHGISEGKYICFGAKERWDVLLWTEYINNRFPSLPIALFGLSMGAATVMMASELSLPESVACILADCGFTSPREIIGNTLRYKHKIIIYPTIFFMNFWSILLAKFNYNEISTLKTLTNNTRPLLLIHGERDAYVPTEMSRRNAEVRPELTELFTVPEAKHAQAVYFDTDGYVKKELEFLDRNMRS